MYLNTKEIFTIYITQLVFVAEKLEEKISCIIFLLSYYTSKYQIKPTRTFLQRSIRHWTFHHRRTNRHQTLFIMYNTISNLNF